MNFYNYFNPSKDITKLKLVRDNPKIVNVISLQLTFFSCNCCNISCQILILHQVQ